MTGCLLIQIKLLAINVQNYINPLNLYRTIRLKIPQQGKVVLKVYDMLGRDVLKLVDQEQNPRSYKVRFNAAGLASGVYLYLLGVAKFYFNKEVSSAKNNGELRIKLI